MNSKSGRIKEWDGCGLVAATPGQRSIADRAIPAARLRTAAASPATPLGNLLACIIFRYTPEKLFLLEDGANLQGQLIFSG
jgi:hypothetical protein